MRYKVNLSTVVSIDVVIEAANEDEAHDRALKVARRFGNEYHSGQNYTVDVNNEWQYEDPEIKELG